MHKNWFLKILLIFIISAFGCNRKNSDKETKEIVSANDSVKFIRIKDAVSSNSNWSKENIVVYQWNAEPDILHPTNGSSSGKTEIFMYTQKSLVNIDLRTQKLIPVLIKSLPEISADGLTLIFEIRNDTKWDNGEPLKVDDIIFTAKANKCPLTDNPNTKSYWVDLKNILKDSINPMKFTVLMKRPYIYNVAFWTGYPIMQKSFFDPENVLGNYSFVQFDDLNSSVGEDKKLREWANNFNNAKYGRDPKYLNGLGPYKVTGWEAGQTLTIERKENYRTTDTVDIYNAAYPAKIIFKVNRDPNSQMLEFKSQVNDASTTLSTQTLLEIQKDSLFNSNYNSKFIDTYNYTYIGINTRPDGNRNKKLFTDKNVRRAMALLIPLDEINRIINKRMNKRMVGPVSFLKNEFNRNLKPLPFDAEQGKKLLKEAGWKDTDDDNILDKIVDNEKLKMEFDLNYLVSQVEFKDMATLFADALLKAGIKVNLFPLEAPVLKQRAQAHNFDMILSSWGGTALPEDFTQLWHTSSWTNLGSNYCGFGNSESDALIDSIKSTINDSLRIQLSKRFQMMVYDEQPYIFLFSGLRRNVIHKRFGNVELYFEKPSILLNNFRLISSGGIMATESMSN